VLKIGPDRELTKYLLDFCQNWEYNNYRKKKGELIMEYTVWVNFQGGYYTTIEANSPDEALEIAENEADPFEVTNSWDVDVEIED
jgi:hypothetical protein